MLSPARQHIQRDDDTSAISTVSSSIKDWKKVLAGHSSTAAATVYRYRAGLVLGDHLSALEGIDVRYNAELMITDTRTHVLAGVRQSGEPHWVRHFTEATRLDPGLTGTSPLAVGPLNRMAEHLLGALAADLDHQPQQ